MPVNRSGFATRREDTAYVFEVGKDIADRLKLGEGEEENKNGHRVITRFPGGGPEHWIPLQVVRLLFPTLMGTDQGDYYRIIIDAPAVTDPVRDAGCLC